MPELDALAATDPRAAVTLKVHRLRPGAVMPEAKSSGAAGMDLSACPEDGEAIILEPGAIALVGCGIRIAVPEGYEAQVRPRSGLASRHGISMPNTPGTIDSDYRGELKVPLINLGREPFTVEFGMRIAQMVIAPVTRARLVDVDELDDTPRGAGGFGSTGV